MSTFKKSLPAEIWLHTIEILQYNKEELMECRLVCKTWNTLAERVLYKEINMNHWSMYDFPRFGGLLSARPEIGQLVHKIQINGIDRESSFIRLLKSTPNLKIIHGICNESIMERLLNSELAHLQLQEVPRIQPPNFSLQSKLICHYKDTLRSVNIDLKKSMGINHLADLRDSIGQCHKLAKVCIQDLHCFQDVKQLEWMLESCNRIEELRLEIKQRQNYTHMEQSKLTRWLFNNVKRIDTVKKLEILYHADGLYATRKLPHELGPDWMSYLAFKYPRVENLHLFNNPANRQLIFQPAFEHLVTVNLQGVAFTNPEVFRQSVNTIGSVNVYINLNVIGGDGMGASPFICIMNAGKEKNANYTTFKFDLLYDSQFDTDLTTVLSCFSTRTIQRVGLMIDDSEYISNILSKVSRAKFDITSLEITTGKLHINKKDYAESFANLRELHLIGSNITAKHIYRLSRMAPNLTHLRLLNCSLKSITLASSSQLAQLELSLMYTDYYRVLFRVSLATSSSSHYLVATRNKPLHIISRQEYKARNYPTIRIKCGTLQCLKVDMAVIKFKLTFDAEQGGIKSADIGMEKSMYYALTKKHSALKEDYDMAEKKCLRAKNYLSTSQIESIEQN